MRGPKKSSLFSFIIACLAFGGVILYDYFAGHSFEFEKVDHQKILIESVGKINEVWISGNWDERARKHCPLSFKKGESYSKEFLTCNPHF